MYMLMKVTMFYRLLALAVVIFHTWLLHSAKSEPIERYKRTLGQRGAGQAATGREHCATVSTSRPVAQQRPHAVAPEQYRRLTDLHHRIRRSLRSCTGECVPDQREECELRDNNECERHRDNSVRNLNEQKSREWRQTTANRAPSSSHADPPDKPHILLRAEGSESRTSKALLNITRIHGPSLWDIQRGGLAGSSNSVRRVPRSTEKSARDREELPKDGAFRTDSQAGVLSADVSVGSEDSSGEEEGQTGPTTERWGVEIQDVPPKWMTALYFSGQREQLKVNPATDIELPRSSFTAELWVRPEGGQNNPAIIAGVFDNCSHTHGERGWSVGIQTTESTGRKDGRFFFALRTDRAIKSTILTQPRHYQPGVWTHVVARYDGQRMTLFVDGSKVGDSSQQSGDLYSPFIKSCRMFLLAGDQSYAHHVYRGYLGGIVLWDHARTHEQLFKNYLPASERHGPLLAFWADFSKADQQWTPYKDGRHPAIVALPAPEQELVSPFVPPSCGVTTCDNPDVILSYNQHWQLRTSKSLRYRVVNVCADDGSRPTVTEQQILQQHRALEDAFRPYNLTLKLTVIPVRNSSLRQRLVLANCHVAKVGNRHCDHECDHPLTGHDGGDCLRVGTCYNWMRGDSVCHPECNTIHYDYDDGDCCDPGITDVTRTCFDPESPERAYLSIKELKELLHLSSVDTLNVFFADNSAREELAGAATWPWAKEALTHQGGMILNPSYYGTVGHDNTMIHEMGHIFGLYHVFKGVSERESCDDPCQETIASMETGDFCADTAPTPKSKACRDPDPVNDTCGLTHYHDTPFNNYMSYTDDNCTNHFTPNQVARMHCYVDLVYRNWLEDKNPAPVPLAPLVVGQDAGSVSLFWLHPVSGPLMQRTENVNCQLCDEHGVLHQYAYKASSPQTCDTSGYWTPEEAVGAPDVYQTCEPSMHSWSPEFTLYEANMSSPCPQSEGCVLQLFFQHAVTPDTLTVWITYISTNTQAVSSLEFLLETGESVHAGPQHAFCDVPLTVRVNTAKKVKGVKICTFDKKLEIDAVLLTSRPRNPLCSACRPLLYRVIRDPPFREDLGPVVLAQTMYTDSDVRSGDQYQYQIQVEADGLLSELSPTLIYTHGQHYCGDGQLQGNETCDDGNLLDGDGCSKKCHKEPGFNCEGQPSLCYVFEGDGVCEEFERGSSIRDCGFFTPPGFTDQWASSAYASHEDLRCPALASTGEPDLSQMCRSQYVEMNAALMREAWTPCTAQSHLNSHYEQEPTWLRVGFARPGVAASVIIYLAYGGGLHGEQRKKTVSIELCDTSNNNHTLGTYELSCQRNPLVVNVTHTLSLPFFQTASVLLNFSTAHVAVLGVALRTSCNFSAFALTGCLHRPCGTNSCGLVKVDHASVNCTPGQDPTQCSITCHRGYVLRGVGLRAHQRDIELYCTNGAWDRVVSCKPVDCGLPDESHIYFATFSCPWGTTFGKQCTFTCKAPATLQGESDMLVCLEDGLWSFPEAYCKIECPDPPVVANARLLMPQCEGSRHNVGTVCRYKCNPGYYVTGTLSMKARKSLQWGKAFVLRDVFTDEPYNMCFSCLSRRFLRLECLKGGIWQVGGCSPVSCPALSAVFEGMYTCTNHRDFESVCTLHCLDPAEKYIIRCTKDGRWTEDISKCKMMEGACPAPRELNQVEYTCNEGYGVGAVCYPTCVVALSDPVVLASNTTADALKHWVLPTKVQNIVCTGAMKWHPSPEQIHCIQSCEPFGGDGWCDTINNRAYCQYDGGDCCPSTLSTRKVIQFGVDCDLDECTCRDPEAVENKGRAKQAEPGDP